MKIREDVQTLPIEINVQSAGVSQEETNLSYKWRRWNWRAILGKERSIPENSRHRRSRSNHTNAFYKFGQATTWNTCPSTEDEPDNHWAIQRCDITAIEGKTPSWGMFRKHCNRMPWQQDILTRQYFDETGNVKDYQILLPQHPLQELLQSLHGTAHKHPGISKLLPEIRQRFYYPGVAIHVKKRVEECEQCPKDNWVPYATITPELPNLLEWDLGPEDAMQIDLLPSLPPSGEYENLLTAINVFSWDLFAYPLTDASAINVAKVFVYIMTKHA